MCCFSHCAFLRVWSIVALALFSHEAAIADAPVDAVDEVQGQWVRSVNTAQGPVRVIKEHLGQKSTVTAYDGQGNVLYAHQSEFLIEPSGQLRIFKHFNRTIIAGPGAGQKTNDSGAYVYRVTNNQFIEVHGLLEDQTDKPGMMVWERVGE